ncbi:MAG: hypothetical protein CMJ78_27375 [Planctomycetaceae bacterium]|nr:hypothetical protein [Planctomycetaceae bacterium]
MTRSAITVILISGVQFLFTVLGQAIVTWRFGASKETDAFILACTPPLIVTTALSWASSLVAVPIFVKEFAKSGSHQAWRIGSAFVFSAIVVVTLIASLGFVFSWKLSSALAPGFSAEQLSLASQVMKVCWLSSSVLVVASVLIAIRNCREQFALTSASALFGPLGTVLGALLLTEQFGIVGVAIGQFVGTVAQLMLLSSRIISPNRIWIPTDLGNCKATLRTAAVMAIPVAIGGSVYLLLPCIERFYASEFGEGAISYLGLAQRLGATVFPILAVGLATPLATKLAKSPEVQSHFQTSGLLSSVTRGFLVVTIPLVVLSPAYAEPLIRTCFEHGQFTRENTVAVARILPLYTLGACASAYGTILGRAFSAVFSDTWTPVAALSGMLVFYVVACELSVRTLGCEALALASCIYWVFSTAIQCAVLRFRLGIAGGMRILTVTSCCTISAALTTVILMVFTPYLSPVAACSAVLVGFVVYAWMAKSVFRVDEVSTILRSIRNVILYSRFKHQEACRASSN